MALCHEEADKFVIVATNNFVVRVKEREKGEEQGQAWGACSVGKGEGGGSISWAAVRARFSQASTYGEGRGCEARSHAGILSHPSFILQRPSCKDEHVRDEKQDASSVAAAAAAGLAGSRGSGGSSSCSDCGCSGTGPQQTPHKPATRASPLPSPTFLYASTACPRFGPAGFRACGRRGERCSSKRRLV